MPSSGTYGMAEHDLTKKSTVRRILRSIRQGNVLSCMMAPPCASFCRARDRSQALRTSRENWGVQHENQLTVDQENTQLGNQCRLSCLRIMHELDKFSIPYILEHPVSSKARMLPPLQKHLSRPCVRVVPAHFCQFGARWQNPRCFSLPTFLRMTCSVCPGRVRVLRDCAAEPTSLTGR